MHTYVAFPKDPGLIPIQRKLLEPPTGSVHETCRLRSMRYPSLSRRVHASSVIMTGRWAFFDLVHLSSKSRTLGPRSSAIGTAINRRPIAIRALCFPQFFFNHTKFSIKPGGLPISVSEFSLWLRWRDTNSSLLCRENRVHCADNIQIREVQSKQADCCCAPNAGVREERLGVI